MMLALRPFKAKLYEEAGPENCLLSLYPSLKAA